jgi:hypothetical protein
MAEETTDWDLLSNGSESDFCWPDSEFDDTLSLFESMSFLDPNEERSKEEVKSESDLGGLDHNDRKDSDEDKEATSICDNTTLIEFNQEYEDVLSISPEDFTTPSDGTPSQTYPVELNSSPHPTASSPESRTPGKTCTAPEIIDRMTSLIENPISSLIEIINSPQILSESEFAIQILEELEWDCTDLKENAHPHTQLVERLDALLSKIVKCLATIGNRETLAAPSPSSSLTQSEIPEWRRHPEPPATPTARQTDGAIKKFRNQFNALNRYTQCQCPSITCRLHPTVFPESRITHSRVEGYNVQCMSCGSIVCRESERGHHHPIDHGSESKDGSWRNAKRFLDENRYSTGRKDSWKNVKTFLDENYIGPEYEEPKRNDRVTITRSRMFHR